MSDRTASVSGEAEMLARALGVTPVDLHDPFTGPPHSLGIVRVNQEGGSVFFVILLGISLVAIGIASTLGGGWATVGAVVLLALGLKVLFMAVMFGLFGRRFRAMRRRGWAPGEVGRHGRWPCGPGSESVKSRMDEWHQMAHAGAEAGTETDPGAADQDDAAAE